LALAKHRCQAYRSLAKANNGRTNIPLAEANGNEIADDKFP